MRHLLIGGAGFLGRHLAQELLSRGDEVAIYDNYSFSEPMTNVEHAGLKVMIGDATNDTSLSSALIAFKPDTVVWLAYFFAYDPAQTPHVRHSWLMHGLIRTIPALSALKIPKFVYVSSDMVYKPSPTPIKENAVINCSSTNMFVADRIIAETYITNICKDLKVPYVLVRPSIVVGKRDYVHPMVDPLGFMIHTLLSGQPLQIRHGQQQRDYITVVEAAEMIANIINKKDSKGIYNVSSGVGLPNAELIQKLVKIITPTVLPKVMESREGHFVLNNTKVLAEGKLELMGLTDEVLTEIVDYRRGDIEEE